MNKATQLLCAHCALVFAVLLGGGIFGVTGLFPPYSPTHTAAEVLQYFQDHEVRIRVGMTLLALGSVWWWPFSAAIAMQMRRMEGPRHPLTYVQMASASGTVVAVIFPAYFWLTMTFRPDVTPAESMQFFNDLSWLAFIGMYPPGLIQNLSIAACILAHPRPDIYPRWVGFANLWIAAGFVPGALLPYFKTGPFAWNGAIGFWMVATFFFGWILMMWWMTVKAIQREPAAEA
ncbi:MAG TPA: hypothetical protein VJM11_16400 [Nevskiaceae bacterium]|nr:hypothetical protein [Nevskiaceae bacterium]